MKEFSKTRLRKRAQSNLLRRPNAGRRRGQFTAGANFNAPLLRRDSPQDLKEASALDLIREEIAIMKKLNHPNLVSLIEVLDDPEEDSLYMVMEMCKNGVVMKIGLGERADPYDEEQCRYWFRDMILGTEYLHAQGIIHRDIKPDNCLITEDGVLKIVDFGVSEMFEKDSEMNTAKSAGSPAFMPPELCVAKHGEVSGRAADIWSLGVTLYCMRYGRLPFEQTGVLELYESIKGESIDLGDLQNEDDWKDLMIRIFEKDPKQRITIEELREHPWVTRKGTDELLPKEENVVNLVEPPTEAELNAAITGNMGRIMVVVSLTPKYRLMTADVALQMKAVKKFKSLLVRRRPDLLEGIFGRASKIVQPPLQIGGSKHPRSHSAESEMRRPVEAALATEGIHRKIKISDFGKREPAGMDNMETLAVSASGPHASDTLRWTENLKLQTNHPDKSAEPEEEPKAAEEASPGSARAKFHRSTGKGQAHNPLEDTLFLDVGAGESSEPFVTGEFPVVSESPSAADSQVYEKAYQEEISRIIAERKSRPTLYLTRRVEGIDSIRKSEYITDHSHDSIHSVTPGLANLIEQARANVQMQRSTDGAGNDGSPK